MTLVPPIYDIDNTLTPEQRADIGDRISKLVRKIQDMPPASEIRQDMTDIVNEIFLAQRAKRQTVKVERERRKAESIRKEASRSRFNV